MTDEWVVRSFILSGVCFCVELIYCIEVPLWIKPLDFAPLSTLLYRLWSAQIRNKVEPMGLGVRCTTVQQRHGLSLMHTVVLACNEQAVDVQARYPRSTPVLERLHQLHVPLIDTQHIQPPGAARFPRLSTDQSWPLIQRAISLSMAKGFIAVPALLLSHPATLTNGLQANERRGDGDSSSSSSSKPIPSTAYLLPKGNQPPYPQSKRVLPQERSQSLNTVASSSRPPSRPHPNASSDQYPASSENTPRRQYPHTSYPPSSNAPQRRPAHPHSG